MNNIPTQPPTSVKDCNAIIFSDLLARIEYGEFKKSKDSDADINKTDYLLLNHKDIFPTSVDIGMYDQAIDKLREYLNNYLLYYNENYNIIIMDIIQPNGRSMAKVFENDSQRSRRYEFEAIHLPYMEVLFAFVYTKGEITLVSGKLPLTEISAVLQEIGAWEV